MEIPYTVKPRPDTGLYNSKVGIWLFLASEVMLFGALFSTYILLRVGAPEGTWPKPQTMLNVPIGTLNTCVLIMSSVTVVLAWASLKLNQFKKFKLFQACTILLALTFLVVKSFEYRDKFTHYEIIKKDGTVINGHLVSQNSDQVVLKGAILPVKGEHKLGDHPNQQTEHDHDHEGAAHGETGEHADTAATEGAHAESGGHHQKFEIARSEIQDIDNYGPWFNTYLAIYFTLTGLHALHVLGGAVVIGYLWGPGSKMWHTEPERFTNRIEISGLFWHFVDLVWIFLFPILYLL